MYKPIDISLSSDAEIRLKLKEAQDEIRRFYENPLIRFYRAISIQLNGISAQLEEEVLIDFSEENEKGGKTKSDKVMDLLIKAEPISRMIETIGSKNFPESYKVEEDDLTRSRESYVKKNSKGAKRMHGDEEKGERTPF